MANGTDFTTNIVVNTKALKDLKKQLDAIAKDVKKQYSQQMKLEGKHSKSRKRELEAQKRLHLGLIKDQKKFQTDLYNSQKKGRSEEWAHARKMERQEKRVRSETTRWRKKEEKEFSRGPFGRMGQRAGGLGRAALRGGFGLAGGIAGFFMGAATSAYGKHIEAVKARSGVIGAASGPQIMSQLRSAKGVRMGYNIAETAGHGRLMARATGTVGPRELQSATRAAMLDPGEAAQMFGQIRQAGYGFSGGVKGGESAGGRQMKNLLAAGVYAGLEKARFPEFAKGVFNVVSQQTALRTKDVSPTDVAKIIAQMSKKGGMDVSRAAGIASKLQGALIKPGGGEWGQSFMQMAMGFGKPGGGTGFYEAEKMREQGLTSGNAQRMISEVIGQFGSGQEGALAMRELTGVGLEQAEALLKIGKDGDFSAEKLAEIDDIMAESKSLEQQGLDAMKGIGGTLKRLAGRFNTFAADGARIAPAVEKMEDWQMKLFHALLDIAEHLKDLYTLIKSWIFEQTGTSKDLKKRITELDEKRKAMFAEGTPEERAKAAKEEIEELSKIEKQATALSEKGTIGKAIEAYANEGVGLAAAKVAGLEEYTMVQTEDGRWQMTSKHRAEALKIKEEARKRREKAEGIRSVETGISRNRGITEFKGPETEAERVARERGTPLTTAQEEEIRKSHVKEGKMSPKEKRLGKKGAAIGAEALEGAAGYGKTVFESVINIGGLDGRVDPPKTTSKPTGKPR